MNNTKTYSSQIIELERKKSFAYCSKMSKWLRRESQLNYFQIFFSQKYFMPEKKNGEICLRYSREENGRQRCHIQETWFLSLKITITNLQKLRKQCFHEPFLRNLQEKKSFRQPKRLEGQQDKLLIDFGLNERKKERVWLIMAICWLYVLTL